MYVTMLRNGDSKNSYDFNHLLLCSHHLKTIKEHMHPYILDKGQTNRLRFSQWV